MDIDFGDEYFINDRSMSELQSAVVPFVVQRPGELVGVGTAFCVAGAGVFATARHVVDAAVREIERNGGRLAILWYGNPPDAADDEVMGLPIPISDVCMHPDPRFDFALLTIAVPWINDERAKILSLHLSFDLPADDGTDWVVMMGYTAFTMEVADDVVRIDHPLGTSLGQVVDVYDPIRDSVNAPFPCFGA